MCAGKIGHMSGQIADIALGIDEAGLLSASLSKTDEFHEGASWGCYLLNRFRSGHQPV
jgi:hypothetical protein